MLHCAGNTSTDTRFKCHGGRAAAHWLVVPCGGVLADRLRTKKILSPTNVRKVMNCGGFGTEAFFLLVLSYTKTRIENVGALIIAVGSSGLAISGKVDLERR